MCGKCLAHAHLLRFGCSNLWRACRAEMFVNEIDHLPPQVEVLVRVRDSMPRTWVEHHVERLVSLLERVGELQRVLQVNVVIHRSVQE